MADKGHGVNEQRKSSVKLNRLLIFGNILFILGVACYFTASQSLGVALGVFGIILEIGGVRQMISEQKR